MFIRCPSHFVENLRLNSYRFVPLNIRSTCLGWMLKRRSLATDISFDKYESQILGSFRATAFHTSSKVAAHSNSSSKSRYCTVALCRVRKLNERKNSLLEFQTLSGSVK